jgi:hypothetical protein
MWWWVVIVAVIIIGAIFVLQQNRQIRSSRAPDRRMTVQQEGGALSDAEEISQREDRRLAGMSVDDRAWEQASLERNRERESRSRKAQDQNRSLRNIDDWRRA